MAVWRAAGLNVTSEPGNDDYNEADETFTFEIVFDHQVSIESTPTIDLLVGQNVRPATLIDDCDLTEVTTLLFEYTFTSPDSDSDGIEILDTDFRVDDAFANGYVSTLAPGYDYMPVWMFFSTWTDVLTYHPVGSGAAGLPWNLGTPASESVGLNLPLRPELRQRRARCVGIAHVSCVLRRSKSWSSER
ncbi:MAG: hypothetical protein OXD50_03325 [Chloroflexi bacterium]|nr:hypothetical protein [Chloroflexota bacterium]